MYTLYSRTSDSNIFDNSKPYWNTEFSNTILEYRISQSIFEALFAFSKISKSCSHVSEDSKPESIISPWIRSRLLINTSPPREFKTNLKFPVFHNHIWNSRYFITIFEEICESKPLSDRMGINDEKNVIRKIYKIRHLRHYSNSKYDTIATAHMTL